MKKIFTAAFILAISFSCISFADSLKNLPQSNNSEPNVYNDSALVFKDTPNGISVQSEFGAGKTISSDNSVKPAEKNITPAKSQTNADREQELKELCEFLCSARNCLGECTDLNCLMQQMYFYTR